MIDEIFLANAQEDVKIVNEVDILDTFDSKVSQTKSIKVNTSNFDYLEMYVKIESNMMDTENTKNKLADVIFSFDGTDMTIDNMYDISGLCVNEIFTNNMNVTSAGATRRIQLDLNQCGLNDKEEMVISYDDSSSMGYFTVSKIKLIKNTEYKDYKVIEEDSKIRIPLQNDIKGENISLTNSLGTIGCNYTGNGYSILQMTIKPDSTDLSSLQLDFDGQRYYVTDSDKLITLVNDVKLKDVIFNKNETKTIYIDLSLMNITAFNNLTIYGTTDLGNIVINNLALGKYESLYDSIIKLSNQAQALETPADITGPVISLTQSIKNLKEQNFNLALSYYDLQTKQLSDLTVEIIITKTQDANGSNINENVSYTRKNESTNIYQSVEKYSCDLNFDITAGTYNVKVKVIDEAGNVTNAQSTLKVEKEEEQQQKKKFDWMIVLIVFLSLIVIAAAVFGVLFLIKYIKGRDNSIKF